MFQGLDDVNAAKIHNCEGLHRNKTKCTGMLCIDVLMRDCEINPRKKNGRIQVGLKLTT